MVKKAAAKGLGAKLKSQPVETGPPHLMIIARAGSGKTTTLVEGMKVIRGLKPSISPSPQQKAIWDELEKSRGVYSVGFAAFAKAIADKLEKEVPPGCEAMTLHRLGSRVVRKAFPNAEVDTRGAKTEAVIESYYGENIAELRKNKPGVIAGIIQVTEKCKMNLVNGTDPEELTKLIDHYGIDLNGSAEEVIEAVPTILEWSQDVNYYGLYDFNDMIWLPIVLNLPIYKFDLLMVDEAQDLNRCQHELALRAGKRLVLCGDPKQAIFGFAGSDSESMGTLAKTLGEAHRGLVTLPLTVTRRCGKAIVREAQRYVPDIEALDSNLEGTVTTTQFVSDRGSYREQVFEGDMVICRYNAPLVSQCLKFLSERKKAIILGREIGTGLCTLITRLFKFKGSYQDFTKSAIANSKDSIPKLIEEVYNWCLRESDKENAKPTPNESKLQALADKRDCIEAFAISKETVAEVVISINQLFSDRSAEGIVLATIHKAKGLEAENVYFLNYGKYTCPSPMAKLKWEMEQEQNLMYVAITRAKNLFVRVC